MRLVFKYLLVSLALNFWFHGNALSSEPTLWLKMDCSDKTQRDDYRNALVSAVQGFTGIIEKVPPDEAKYIQSELKAALESKSSARWELVTQRPYYRAYEVHKAAKSVIDALNSRPQHTLKLQAGHAIDATVEFVEFKNSFFEYFDFDSRRRKSVVSKETRENMYFALPSQLHNFIRFSKCLVKAIN